MTYPEMIERGMHADAVGRILDADGNPYCDENGEQEWLKLEYGDKRAPHALTGAEWAEACDVVGDSWGAETGAELADVAFGVRFDYMPSSPGYVGDVFVILGDLLEEPCILVRDRDGRMQLVGDES